MRALWLLTKKNLKLLLRSKSSALIVILAPLLIMLIIGLSYNTSTTGLNIGVYSTSFNEDVNSFISSLQEQDYKIVKYEKSIDECVGDIKLGFVHTCINVPESFKVEGNTPKEITFYLDPSRINLVWMIQENLKTKFNLKSQQISQELTQEMLAKITETKTKLGERKNELTAIKEKISSASSSTESAKTGLAGLDLAAPAGSYDLTTLDTFKSSMNTEITIGTEKVDSALSSLGGINMSSGEKTSLRTLLNDAKTKLGSAALLLNGTDAGSISKVSEMVTSMQTDLASAKTKLTAASDAVSSASTNLQTVTTTIGESITAVDSLQTALSEMQAVLEGQKVTEAGTIVTPLVTKIEKVGEEGNNLNYLFPIMLIIVIMFTSLLLGTTLVMMEKNSPAFLRNFFLPLRKTTFILSTYLTNLILIIIQVVIILGISLIFLKEALPSIPLIFLVLLIASSVFTFLGMALGYAFISEETGTLASISLGSLLLFFSGVILPLESVSPLLREITFFNPYVLAEKLVREIFIFNSSFSNIWPDLLILLGYAIALFFIILIAESFLHKHLINRFMKHHHKLHREADKQNKNDV